MTHGGWGSAAFFGATTALAAGIAIAIQGALNQTLARTNGPFSAVAVSGLGAGTLALLAFAATRGSASLHSAPVWAYFGGACGFVLLLGITLAVPRIGALSTAALVVAAQLAMAAAIDQFGWLGVSTRPLSATRLSALVGMLFFAWLSVRR